MHQGPHVSLAPTRQEYHCQPSEIENILRIPMSIKHTDYESEEISLFEINLGEVVKRLDIMDVMLKVHAIRMFFFVT